MDNPPAWKSTEAAEIFNKIADTVIPRRRELISTVAAQAMRHCGENPKVLDLGCGNGDLTAEILRLKPGASVTMVDFNDEMLHCCGDRFSGKGQITIAQLDLNGGIPASIGSGFDAVVSACTVHVIRPDARLKLYSDICNVLKDNGPFVNGDRVRGESPEIESREFDAWIQFRVDRLKETKSVEKSFDEVKREQLAFDTKMGHKPCTVWEAERDLRTAGFRYVDVIWKYLNFAVIAGIK
jgi:tRNA (cmo5U34)-methyltransferase